MNGVIAILGDDIFFSLGLMKNNQHLVHWGLQDMRVINGTVFLPLNIHDVYLHEAIFKPSIYQKPYFELTLKSGIGGILIDQHGQMYEVGIGNEGIELRSVPRGPTMIYTRANSPDVEDVVYNSIKMTGDLRLGLEHTYKTISGMYTDPVYTTIDQLVHCAKHDKDLSEIPKREAALRKRNKVDITRALKASGIQLTPKK